METIVLSLALIALLMLFITERFPAEVSAFFVVMVLVVLTELDIGLHILTPVEAVMGFASSGVVTVGAMFVMAAGLSNTGVVEYLGDKVISLSGGSPWLLLTLSVIVIAFFSSFVNNTPIVVLFVPLILKVCYSHDLSPSKFLIPVSYASILGGTTTLIGTSTNLLVAGVISQIAADRPEIGLKPLSMYSLTPVGIPIAIAGLLFIILFSKRLLPERKTVTSTLVDYQRNHYMTELTISQGSSAAGKTVSELLGNSFSGLTVLEVMRGGGVLYPPYNDLVLQEGDTLLSKGSARDILGIHRSKTAEIAPELGETGLQIAEKNITLAELVMIPASRFIGMTIEEAQINRRYNITVIALLRHGMHIHEFERLRKVRLRLGDTLLVQGDRESILRIRQAENIMLLEGIGDILFNYRKAPVAAGIFISVILGATFNIMPIMLLAVLGAMLMIITGCVRSEKAYKSINAPVLLLISSSIALGSALQNTGTAAVYADFVTGLLGPLGPYAILGGLFLLTTVLTEFISNNATAILMTHIAVATAIGLGVSPMPFVMAVVFGASACFATPIGYQTNLFVYGAGGYKFSDFSRMGLIMNLIVFFIGMLLIPLVWPL